MSPVLAPKTTLVTLDLTHQVLATRKTQSLILSTESDEGSSTTVLRQILHGLLTFFAHTYDSVFGIDAGPPLHDPVAVAVLFSNLNNSQMSGHQGLLQFDDKQGERYLVNVVTDGSHGNDVQTTGEVGRTVVTKVADGCGGVTIPASLDVDRFWAILLDCLERAEKCVSAQSIPN